VKDPDEPCLFDLRADLLPALTRRCLPRALVIVDETTGKAPQSKTGLDGAAPEQDPAIHLDDHCRADLWVVPQDEVIVGTCFELATFDDAWLQHGSALDAVVAHQLELYGCPSPVKGGGLE
jgi:hypothetical protein